MHTLRNRYSRHHSLFAFVQMLFLLAICAYSVVSVPRFAVSIRKGRVFMARKKIKKKLN